MNSHQTEGFAECMWVVVPLITWIFVTFDPSRFHGCLQIVAAAAGCGAARCRAGSSQHMSFSVSKNFIHCNTERGLLTCYCSRDKSKTAGISRGASQNGNPKLSSFKAFHLTPRRELKLMRLNNLPHMLLKLQVLLFLPQSISRGFAEHNSCTQVLWNGWVLQSKTLNNLFLVLVSQLSTKFLKAFCKKSCSYNWSKTVLSFIPTSTQECDTWLYQEQ